LHASLSHPLVGAPASIICMAASKTSKHSPPEDDLAAATLGPPGALPAGEEGRSAAASALEAHIFREANELGYFFDSWPARKETDKKKLVKQQTAQQHSHVCMSCE